MIGNGKACHSIWEIQMWGKGIQAILRLMMFQFQLMALTSIINNRHTVLFLFFVTTLGFDFAILNLTQCHMRVDVPPVDLCSIALPVPFYIL